MASVLPMFFSSTLTTFPRPSMSNTLDFLRSFSISITIGTPIFEPPSVRIRGKSSRDGLLDNDYHTRGTTTKIPSMPISAQYLDGDLYIRAEGNVDVISADIRGLKAQLIYI